MRLSLSIALVSILFFVTGVQAQQDYTIDGETYSLVAEVEGPLTLLWNKFGKEYRYFSKKGDEIVELKNSKVNGQRQEEYKDVLRRHTQGTTISIDDVKLSPRSLYVFYTEYNDMQNPNYAARQEALKVVYRLGGFAGVDNSIYTDNPENAMHPVIGLDFEITDRTKLERHALVVQFKQTFEASDHKYSASQFSLNYRFKFVKTPKLDVFVNVDFASLSLSSHEYEISADEGNGMIKVSESNTGFNAPISLGIGADYRLGDGYLTFGYNDIVALNMDSNKEFPINFTLGYKFNL